MLFPPCKEDYHLEHKRKVVKFKQRRSINIGVIIFIIMFFYIGANIFMYFTKDRLSVYEVQAGTSAEDTVTTGVIIRNEELIYTKTAGYISYYQKEGERVAKKSKLYSVDENKQVYELMTNNSSIEFTKSDLANIQKDVSKFMKRYSDNNYYSVTDFKYDMENLVSEVMYERALDNVQDVMKANGIESSFKVVKAKKSGIVTYHFDGLEGLKAKEVTAETFNQDNYKKTQLRTSNIIGTDQPVCKIITDQNWSIVVSLTQAQYEHLQDKERVRITILNNGFETVVPVQAYESNNNYFAKLSMSKYMENYLDERFLDVQLHINYAKGLKIPKTSVTEKDFYVVPLTMFSKGADSNDLVLTTITYDVNGDFTASTVTPKIYYKDDEYAYVSVELFDYGTKIKSPETQDVLQLTTTSTLQGVYNVNKGYFVFEKVDIIYENENYYIVKEGAANSISKYDKIALDVNTVMEDGIIY